MSPAVVAAASSRCGPRTLRRGFRRVARVLAAAPGPGVSPSRSSSTSATPDPAMQRDPQAMDRAYVRHVSDTPLRSTTMGRLLQSTTDMFGDREAVVSVYQNQRMTFYELLQKADKLAAGLRSLGLSKGERVAVWGPNSSEWVVTKMAVARAGLTLVTLNPAYQAKELSHCLKKVGVKALICNHTFKTQNYPNILYSVAPEVPNCKPYDLKSEEFPDLKILITITDEDLPGSMKFSDALHVGTDQTVREVQSIQDQIDPHDISELQFTSGTTGEPKAVILTHYGTINNAYFHNLRTKKNYEADRLIVCALVPFFHVFASTIGITACLDGGDTLVIASPTYHPDDAYKAIRQEKCEIVFGAPTMFVDLLRVLKQNDGKGFDCIKCLWSGGAIATQELMKNLAQALPNCFIKQGYGMTETSPATFTMPMSAHPERPLRYVGQLKPHLEAKIVDAKGNTVAFGEPGELCIRGYVNTRGYWKDEKKTKELIDKEGWLRTGDRFVLEEDGYARIVGRIKELIIRGGENIAPKEVEDALETHPNVLEATVYGVPDERMQEEVAASIRLKNPAETITVEDMRAYLKGKIAHFKIPRYLEVVQDFPKTASGKVQKFKLQAELTKKLKLSSQV